MPKEARVEPGEIHPAFWRKTVKEAFKNDPPRILIELIKNSVDSYKKLEKNDKTELPFDIFVKFFCSKNTPPIIEVIDYAQGMSSKKLKEALKYGTQTSMDEDVEALTSAEKGIGLKDSLMALENNWLTTIKDGLINERSKHPDFKTGFGKEDEKITDEERKKIGIPKNGTSIRGKLPNYFRFKKFPTICEYLEKHFLLRKILQSSKFRIHFIDGCTSKEMILKYKPPKIDKEILKEELEIKYNGKSYLIHLTINKTEERDLGAGKPYGESGLLFYYSEYSVVDFTFSRFDREPSFSRLFGEVKMEVEDIIRDPEESPLVDEKRRGLDPEHPFNKKLFELIDKKLKTIYEKEEASNYSFDKSTIRDVLSRLNKIYKDIKGRGPPLEPPIKPETFAFYPVFVTLKEYEPKMIHLVINSTIISDVLEITLESTNPDIKIKNSKITLKGEDTNNDNFIIKGIEVYSEKKGIDGDITATVKEFEQTEKMGVEIIENPIFDPDNGFSFIPNKTTIVNEGEKKVELYVDKSEISDANEINFVSQDPISSAGKLFLPKKENLAKHMIKNIIKLEVPIKAKRGDFIGEKSILKAKYKDKESELKITIVPEPSITGLFRNIRYSPKITYKIAHFVDEEGVLEIYYNHPLIKSYMKGNFKDNKGFLVFIADVIAREAVRGIVLSGVRENSSRFPIFDPDHPESYIEDHIDREYFEQGPEMHEMFVKLAKTLNVKG